MVMATLDTLLEDAPDATTTARLLAASTSESGAWLNALPISSLGLRMDNNTIRVAVGIRLGTKLCRPHMCHHCTCGSEVDGFGIHGLSCRWSECHHHRHSALFFVLCRQQRSLQGWNLPVYTDQMANAQMACPLYHGRAESCLSGMSCAPTLLHPHTPPSQAPNQVSLLPKQRRGSAQSTVTSAQTTFSPPSPLRHLAPWVRKPVIS